MNTICKLEHLWDEDAFHDFVDYHNDHPITARELYDLIKDGQLTFNDLPDFNWEDYLTGPL